MALKPDALPFPQGECPFGNKCFYRHLSPEGVDVDVGPPMRRQPRQNADGESDSPRTILLYNFLEERDGRFQVRKNYLLFFSIQILVMVGALWAG